jgi:hypothetical protein
VQTFTVGPNYFASIYALIWSSATAKTPTGKGANRLRKIDSIFLSRKIGCIRNDDDDDRLASHRPRLSAESISHRVPVTFAVEGLIPPPTAFKKGSFAQGSG